MREGLDVATEPVQTVLRGRLPDQAALLGILATARLLGLGDGGPGSCLRVAADQVEHVALRLLDSW